MATFFVLYDGFSRMFVRAGNRGGWTYSLNCAKHFTSVWSACNYRDRFGDLCALTVKKVSRE